MKFVDKALARRLESAEEMPQVDCARMYQKLRPEIGAAFEPICGGHMIFAGLNSPIRTPPGWGSTVRSARPTWTGWKCSIVPTAPRRNSTSARSPTTDRPTLLELLNLPRLKAEDSRFHPQRLTWRSYPRSTGV